MAIDRRQLREFVDALLTDGAKPATAVSRCGRRSWTSPWSSR
jgi:hypothetical protein